MTAAPRDPERDDLWGSAQTGVNRRDFIKIGSAGTATLALGATVTATWATPAHAEDKERGTLRFNRDGSFKIVQFNDTQDDERIDRRTLELMNKVLDSEEPDLVILNGDIITDGCDSALEMKQAMNNVVQPMEQRGIPWAITYGNHDEDSTPKGGLDEADMLDFYRSYTHNRNPEGAPDIAGTGNANVIIRESRGRRAAFNLWLLDSGRYAPERIAGQDFEGYPTWDWIRMNQVQWYAETSRRLEKEEGGVVPALMFIHIPLWEYRFMWYGSVDGRTEDDHARGKERHQIVGERNEDECPGPVNSGMFSAILDRGDVKGVFCGHDHVNTYMGNYYGVLLGYSGNTGFGTYGLSGDERNRLRCARVFTLDENTEDVLVESHLVFAKDLGIDLSADDQSIEPQPLPDDKKARA